MIWLSLQAADGTGKTVLVREEWKNCRHPIGKAYTCRCFWIPKVVCSISLVIKDKRVNTEKNVALLSSIILPIIAILLSLISLYFSVTSEIRTQQLFQSQKMSDIHLTPISFTTYIYKEANNQQMARLTLDLVNYTGFKASNVKVDANFSGEWINEWVINAANGLEGKKKRGEFLPKSLEKDLVSYKYNDNRLYNFDMKPNAIERASFQGAFHFKPKQKNILIVRVSWNSDNNAHFDKFFRYELQQSEAYGAKSFVIIPVSN